MEMNNIKTVSLNVKVMETPEKRLAMFRDLKRFKGPNSVYTGDTLSGRKNTPNP